MKIVSSILVITALLVSSSADAKRLKYHRAPSLQESQSTRSQPEDIMRPSIFFPGFGVRAPNTKQEQRKFIQGSITSHPMGCPHRAFCGCGASVAVFGHPVRSLYLASAWFKFPHTSPQSGAVAVRRGHVFVLKQHIEGNIWMVYDANSGGNQTRIHERSITGYTIVMPTSYA